MIPIKKMMTVLFLTPWFAFGAADSDGVPKKNLNTLVTAYTKMLDSRSTSDQREKLFGELCGRIFGVHGRSDTFTAATLRRGSPDEVIKILPHLPLNDSIADDSEGDKYRGCPLHYLVQRIFASTDYKNRKIFQATEKWLGVRREALTVRDSRGLIPFDLARQEIGDRGVPTCPLEESYRDDVLYMLVPDAQGLEVDARNRAYALISDDAEEFEQARSMYEKASPEFAQMIKEQFCFIKPGVIFDSYLMKDCSMEDVLVRFVFQNGSNESALLWARFLLSSKYERSKEITPKMRSELLFDVIRMGQVADDLVDELISAGADPCKEVSTGAAPIAPIVWAVLYLSGLTEGVDFASGQICRILKAINDKYADKASSFDASELQMFEHTKHQLRSMFGEFGSFQSPQAYEEHYEKWEAICKQLGADIPGLRKMVWPLLKQNPDNNDRRLLKMFQQEFDPFHSFAMACVTTSFIHGVASATIDLHEFCLNGAVKKVSRNKRAVSRIDAEQHKMKLNRSARDQVNRVILKGFPVRSLTNNVRDSTACSSSSSSSYVQ